MAWQETLFTVLDLWGSHFVASSAPVSLPSLRVQMSESLASIAKDLRGAEKPPQDPEELQRLSEGVLLVGTKEELLAWNRALYRALGPLVPYGNADGTGIYVRVGAFLGS
ncbi:MAG: hypothetical protein BroJett014_04600 [Planctomycetota bacterium]|nr:MAG: hypothetical protein BroJett014_04600 [Planctomycetota bacterium]